MPSSAQTPDSQRRAARWAPLALLLASGVALAEGAPQQPARANPDPLEGMNRATYAFNDFIDRHLARPVARGYRAVLPDFARRGIGNFFANLSYPTVIVNDVLQGKLRHAAGDTTRFVVNSLMGIGGLADPATRMGLVAHDEDFGQTLGRWGVGPGPYLVLPLLGPSDLRDAPGRYVDHYTNAAYLIEDARAKYSLLAIDLVDRRASLLAADEALKAAFDPYALMRNAYLQRREYLVRDGQVPDDTSYEDPLDP
jgi:phospholipid-binding lipoprotein MlaA